MKKILFMIMFTCCACMASAQIESGTFLVGASSNIGYNNLSPDNSSGYTIMNIDLKGGYFVINNLVLGLNVGYTKVDEFSELSIGAFTRYYIAGKFFAGAGFTSIKTDETDAVTEIPIELGYAAFVAGNFAIEPSLSYAMGDGYERFGANLGFMFYLGR